MRTSPIQRQSSRESNRGPTRKARPVSRLTSTAQRRRCGSWSRALTPRPAGRRCQANPGPTAHRWAVLDGPRRIRAEPARSVPRSSGQRQSAAGAAHTAHGRAPSCPPTPSSASLSVSRLASYQGSLSASRPSLAPVRAHCRPVSAAAATGPVLLACRISPRDILPSLPCDDPSSRPLPPPECTVASRGCGAASRTHQADASAGRCVCLAWKRWGDQVLYCLVGIAVHAGGLTRVCLVPSTAAVEVIPTNDLPPSTPPRGAVVRCGTR
jgi:hypothetical protein